MTCNLREVPADRQCGAKTRKGTPCKKWAVRGRTRCRNHGGCTPFGMGSPHLKHGWYSRYFPYAYLRAGAQGREKQRHRLQKRLQEEGLDPALADKVI